MVCAGIVETGGLSGGGVVRTLFVFIGFSLLSLNGMSQEPFDVVETSVSEIHEAYASGSLTARRLVELYLERIEAYDQQGPAINAVISLNEDALRDADRLDAAFRDSGFTGPLHGIPIAIKDQVDVVGLPTT